MNVPPDAIKQFLVFRIMLQTLLVRFQCFLILFHEKLDSTLSGVTFGKCWIEFDTFFSIFESFRHRPKFCVTSSPITVCLKIKQF